MGRIRWTRVIAGGLAAGLVINVSGFVLRGIVLEEAFATVMGELDRSSETALLPWLLHGFAFGIASLWMYAAMRPRFGEGARTVLYAGTAVWFLTYFTEAAGLVMGEFFLGRHPEFMLISTLGVAWGWAELCVATALGAWLYQRREETRDAEARVAKINWPRMMLAGLVVSMVFPLLTGLFFLSLSLLGVGISDPETLGLSVEAMGKLGLPVASSHWLGLVRCLAHHLWDCNHLGLCRDPTPVRLWGNDRGLRRSRSLVLDLLRGESLAGRARSERRHQGPYPGGIYDRRRPPAPASSVPHHATRQVDHREANTNRQRAIGWHRRRVTHLSLTGLMAALSAPRPHRSLTRSHPQ